MVLDDSSWLTTAILMKFCYMTPLCFIDSLIHSIHINHTQSLGAKDLVTGRSSSCSLARKRTEIKPPLKILIMHLKTSNGCLLTPENGHMDKGSHASQVMVVTSFHVCNVKPLSKAPSIQALNTNSGSGAQSHLNLNSFYTCLFYKEQAMAHDVNGFLKDHTE